jgi:arachidonate 15-lipoxygenase
MVVASHNALEKNDHPLGWFLKPHFRDNIGINYLARQTLVADKGAITDKTFATGTKQGVGMVAAAFESYDFLTSGFPDELKKRGFDRVDNFKGYRCRDDGWLIWDSLWTYSEDMVNALYKSDADVAADKVVQEWCVEASDEDKADIHGFPKAIKEKALLVKVLTTTIWTASALHSALNYAQYPYTATPINRAAKINAGVPDGSTDITDEYIMKAVPAGLQSGFKGLLSWILATPEHPTLDEVSDRIPNKTNPLPWVEFRSKYREVFINFDKNLDEIEENIKKRNEGLTVPYEVLLPSQIAASINI